MLIHNYKLVHCNTDGNCRIFSPIYNFSNKEIFLSILSTGLGSVMSMAVVFQSVYREFASSWRRCFFFFFFLSFLLQCEFNILSVLSFFYFVIPYNAQAPCAFSALIICPSRNLPLQIRNDESTLTNTDLTQGRCEVVGPLDLGIFSIFHFLCLDRSSSSRFVYEHLKVFSSNKQPNFQSQKSR